MRDLSEPQRPVQLILTRIWPGPGEGTGMVWMDVLKSEPRTAARCWVGTCTDMVQGSFTRISN